MAAATSNANQTVLKPPFHIETSGEHDATKKRFIIFLLSPADQRTLLKEWMIRLYLKQEGYEYTAGYDEIIGDKLYIYYEDLGPVFKEYDLFNEDEIVDMVLLGVQQRGSAMIAEMKKGQDAEGSETK